jgi:hypothetical protein
VVDGHSAQHEALRQAVREEANARLRESWADASGGDILDDIRRGVARYASDPWPFAGAISATRDGHTRWFASQAEAEAWLAGSEPVRAAEAELPAGWREADKGRNFMPGTLVHVSDSERVMVWPRGEAWLWISTTAGARDYVPTRDEAMARALGWEPDRHGIWRYKFSCWASDQGGGPWEASNAGAARGGFRSLPHAIAWCRGDDY